MSLQNREGPADGRSAADGTNRSSTAAGVRGSDLRGCARMAVDATAGVVGVAQALHQTIARRADPLNLTGAVTGLVYGTVRAITALVGTGIELTTVIPSNDGEGSSARREAILAVLNGVVGDYLSDTGNPLGIQMRFRRDGQPLELKTRALAARVPDARARIMVLVHGLCLNDLQWARDGEDRGAALALALGYTPVHLHYNSGLHVSTNGRQFSELLETLVAQWPVRVEDLVILAHSMGGLVARSACDFGAADGCDWPNHLRKIVFLGTPHHGTTLERAGNWIDAVLDATAFTAPFARLGKIRSAGITDLRFGSTRDDDWQGRDRFGRDGDCRAPMPLPPQAQCYAVAAVTGTGGLRDRLLGDGFVPAHSALGTHDDARLALRFPESHRWTCHGMDHFDLLSRLEVYERLAGWLTA